MSTRAGDQLHGADKSTIVGIYWELYRADAPGENQE